MAAPVDEARDEYADAMNLELRQSIAARVLEAMDVDQYLIDAVRNAKPPVAKPAVEEPTGFGSVVRVFYPPSAELKFIRTYSVDVDKPWCSGNHLRSWADVIDTAREVEVLRVGLGEIPSQSQRAAQDDAYLQGRVEFKERTLAELRKLRANAITFERQNAHDNDIKAVEGLS